MIHFHVINIWFNKALSLRYFAIKFDLLMFSNISNIFDTISKFAAELKVYFLLLTKATTKKWTPM